MRFFSYDGGRRSGGLWTWRSTAVVTCLALVSSLAVGLGAAGGLSVLDEPGGHRLESPPPAVPRPPTPSPLDPQPPPPPNPAEVSDPAPPEPAPDDDAPSDEPETEPETVEVRVESDPVDPVPVPESDGRGDVTDGTWTAVTDSWIIVESGFELLPDAPDGDWTGQRCTEESGGPGGETSESGRYPTWDTGYPDRDGYEP